MLFTLGFDGRKSEPTVYVVADSIREAYDKFYASRFTVKFGELVNINDFSSDIGVIDIHKGNNPILFGYKYEIPNKIECEGMCIADFHTQVMDHFKDQKVLGIWRISINEAIVLT